MLNTICFDVGETLVNFQPNNSFYRELANLLLADEDTVKRYIKAHISNKNVTLDTFAYLIRERFNRKELSLSRICEVSSQCTSTYKLCPGVLETLEELRKRNYKIIAVSNTLSFRYIPLQELCIGQYIDQAFYSFECGYVKPDKAFFNTVTDRLGITGRDIVLIGDSLKSDYWGAKSAGWNAILLNRERAKLPPSIVQIYDLLDLLTLFR